jgi:hypothetical protein
MLYVRRQPSSVKLHHGLELTAGFALQQIKVLKKQLCQIW